MREKQPQESAEVEQLEQESQRLLAELMAKLHELDAARAQHVRPRTREEVKRSLRVIQGGATAVGAAAIWAWETARKPALVMVAGTGTLTSATIISAPLIEPGTASPPPAVVRTVRVPVDDIPAERDEQRSTPEPVAETPAPSKVDKAPVVPIAEPYTPAAQQPKDEPEPSPSPSPSPVPRPTATATVTAPPIVDIEVNADSDGACVESGLVGLELAVCLEAATR